MKIVALYIILSVILLTVQSSGTKQPKLMLFQLDGFRWDYFQKTGINLPAFKRIFNVGIRAEYTTVDFPALSMTNYYSIMTGLHAENHGMIGNDMYDEVTNTYFDVNDLRTWRNSTWWNDAEPLWVTAVRQGKRTYMLTWPGCDIKIRGISPTFCEPYFYGNGRYPSISEMSHSINKAVQLFKTDSADLVAIHTETIDAYGHEYGPDSPQLNQKIEEIDGMFGQLLDNLTSEGLEKDVVIMIFSDHGMTDVTPERTVNLTGYIDKKDLKARVVSAGTISSVWPQKGKLDKVYNNLITAKNKIGHFRIFKKNEIPREWHYKDHHRVAPITIVADFGWFLLHPDYTTFPSYKSGPMKGHHGYDPKYQDMRGIFVAAGPGIKKNVTVKPINVVDIYQLMCHVLKIKASQNNGTWSNIEDILIETSSASSLRFMGSLIVFFAVVLSTYTLC